MELKIIKCPNCKEEKQFSLVVDKYENNVEIPRLRCLKCNKTYEIILGEEV